MGIKFGEYSTVEKQSVFITPKHHKLECNLLLESIDSHPGRSKGHHASSNKEGWQECGDKKSSAAVSEVIT